MIYNWASLIWFSIFDHFTVTINKNQSNMVVGFIGLLFLSPRTYFRNLRLSTSESNEHILENYHKV